MDIDFGDTWPSTIFVHYLKNLDALVVMAEEAERERSSSLLQARLVPDMFPFGQQVSTAVSFSLRALCPLVNRPVPEIEQPENFVQLRDLIEDAVHFLQQLEGAELEGFEGRIVSTRAGLADRAFKGRDFLIGYALPNFLFHYSMAYAILRSEGLPVGKQNFDGFHEYPPGFSFTGQ